MRAQATSSKLENFLFKFTRLLALGGSVLALAVLTIMLFKQIPTKIDTHVSVLDVNIEKTSGSSVSEASSRQLDTETTYIPENVEKHLSGEDNQEVLAGWLRSIPEQDLKDEFVENLSEVIEEAEELELNVMNIINNYKTIKLSKLRGKGTGGYLETIESTTSTLIIFGLIVFIAQLSMILVMLAIERNTRSVDK